MRKEGLMMKEGLKK